MRCARLGNPADPQTTILEGLAAIEGSAVKNDLPRVGGHHPIVALMGIDLPAPWRPIGAGISPRLMEIDARQDRRRAVI